MARSRSGRLLQRRAGRSGGWLHPFLVRIPGGRNRRQAFRWAERASSDRRARGSAGRSAALGALAGRGVVSSSLRRAAGLGGGVGRTAADRRRRTASVSRACRVNLARPLFLLDPERAHRLAVRGLSLVPGGAPAPTGTALATEVAGIRFPNPLGLAAGFDKNAEAVDGTLALGFGFTEIGTVTPLPQPGSPKPRLFRLEESRAVINRMGFNGEGHEAAHARLAKRAKRGGIVGINIGANKDSADRMADYEAGVRRFGALASYLTVNISSPNTPGLRALQGREALRELLGRVTQARAGLAGKGAQVPVFLKIAPDLDEAGLAEVAEEVLASGIEGVIVSNTTLARPLPAGTRHAEEAGGLSGRPLFERATVALARLRRLVGPSLALIGAGGVELAETAAEKVRAGADLVQIYSGLVYGGPALPRRILSGLRAIVENEGGTLRAMRDTRLDHWAAKPLAG
ncbi:MAG: dihydroorotate dehydrogenase (quinone) [Mesorhizobium amorphae]|nr:MAG: dihydroorotate dehydrogenase (quinone) [Mesorhizobium amorphae]